MTSLANWAFGIVGAYLACGAVFAIPFVVRGVNRVDKVARESSWGFRLIIVPGVIALWPMLLRRWISGAAAPSERNPHRDAAQQAS